MFRIERFTKEQMKNMYLPECGKWSPLDEEADSFWVIYSGSPRYPLVYANTIMLAVQELLHQHHRFENDEGQVDALLELIEVLLVKINQFEYDAN